MKRFQAGVAQLARGLSQVLPDHYVDDMKRNAQVYTKDGVPKDLGLTIAGLVNLAAAPDIVALAQRRKLDPTGVAKLYFAVGSRFRLGRLRAACEALEGESHWQKLAVSALTEELFGQQRQLTENVLGVCRSVADPARAIDQWVVASQAAVDRTEQLLAELWAGDIGDISMIAVASRALKSLADERP